MPIMDEYQKSNALTVMLNRIGKTIEKRLQETRIKAQKLNDVFISERSERFHLEGHLDLGSDVSGKVLLADVVEARQRALERRNSELERRLMVNETINRHFEEFESELVATIEDALKAEKDRVAVVGHVASENSSLRKKLQEQVQHNASLTDDRTALERKLSDLGKQNIDHTNEIDDLKAKLIFLDQERKQLQDQSEVMLKRLEQDGRDFNELDQKYESLRLENANLQDEIHSKNDQLEIQTRKTKAISEEMEQRLQAEKDLLKADLLKTHEDILIAERNAHNLMAQRMKKTFEAELKKGAEYVDDLAAKLLKCQREHKDLKQQFDKKLIEAVTAARQALERKYMKLASVQVELPKSSRSVEIEPEPENLPRKILQNWLNSEPSTDVSSSVSSYPS